MLPSRPLRAFIFPAWTLPELATVMDRPGMAHTAMTLRLADLRTADVVRLTTGLAAGLALTSDLVLTRAVGLTIGLISTISTVWG